MKPDGDAMGSCVAMYHFLYVMGKSPRIVLNDRHPAYLDFLTQDIADISVFKENPKDASKAIEDSDLIICLDFNAFHRTDNLSELLESAKADKILIDHHLSPEKELFSIAFSETEISSASELLYHILLSTSFINGNAASLPRRAAEALMTGMTTDTNNFANSVFSSTLQMASALLGAGVDRDKILTNLYNRFSESRLRLLGHIMKDLLRITDSGVAYIVLDSNTLKEYNVMEGDTEGFVNMPLSISNVKMSILIKEDTGKARVSIRSKKGTSANMCARRYFNGGGHENAAGGRLNIPGDIENITQAGAYIEEKTTKFMIEENEKHI
jgi:phosphoesterase RecJ-like protein